MPRYDQQLRLARASEDAGFDAYFRSDHLLSFMGDGEPGPTDTWTTLAGLARDTSRIRLGTLVTSATFRHPGMLALSVTQVDAMSGGPGRARPRRRLVRRRARGVRDPVSADARALRAARGAAGDPDRALDDAARARSSTSPASTTSCRATRRSPRPTQQPHPPVIVGGVGAKTTPRLAARFAAEFNVPFAPLDDVRTINARVDEACAAAGRDPATLLPLDGADRLRAAATTPRSPAAPRRSASRSRTCKNQLAGTVNEVVDRLGAIARPRTDPRLPADARHRRPRPRRAHRLRGHAAGALTYRAAMLVDQKSARRGHPATARLASRSPRASSGPAGSSG